MNQAKKIIFMAVCEEANKSGHNFIFQKVTNQPKETLEMTFDALSEKTPGMTEEDNKFAYLMGMRGFFFDINFGKKFFGKEQKEMYCNKCSEKPTGYMTVDPNDKYLEEIKGTKDENGFICMGSHYTNNCKGYVFEKKSGGWKYHFQQMVLFEDPLDYLKYYI